jgi:hypothetical protein
MNPLRLPKQTVESISPAGLTAYLESTGWQTTNGRARAGFVVFQHPEHRDARVDVLLNRDFPDYALRVADVIFLIAAVENRSAWQVLQDLTEPSLAHKGDDQS